LRSGIETERGGVSSVAAPLGIDCAARTARVVASFRDAPQLFRVRPNCVKRPPREPPPRVNAFLTSPRYNPPRFNPPVEGRCTPGTPGSGSTVETIQRRPYT